jgi:photosystem II stability/assembly factor-like uncharacterized protein
MPVAMNIKRLAKQRNISVEQVELLHHLRGLTAQGIEALPEKTLHRALRRLDYPDAPRARLEFRRRQCRDDQGQIPSQPLLGALRDLDSLRMRSQRGTVAGVPTGGRVRPSNLAPIGPGTLPILPPPLAGLHNRKWEALGPGNIGGRTRAIVIHPSAHDTMWAGSAGGGIWRTDDAGQTWAPVDDFMANLAVTSIIMDPNDPNLMYAGTGEGFGNMDAIRGGGLFRTTNGATWAHIASTGGSNWNSVNRLALSADGATLLAATNSGLRRSVDPGRNNWQEVLPGPIADVKFHPTNPLRALAGSLSSGASWVTTDGGATWAASTHSAAWGGRVELCYASAQPDIVYASVTAGNGEIWRSSNGGRTFTKRRSRNPDGDTANYLGDQGWYDNVIWAGDPTNPDLVIVGGIDLWRSTDGGHGLTEISTWWDPRSAHADHHAIVAHPGYDGTTNRTVFFGNDGGIYRADDVVNVGSEARVPKILGWNELNNTYGVTQFYAAAGNPTTGVIIAGAQDNGTLAFDPAKGAQAWTPIFGGDGGFCCADPADPQIFYGQYVYLGLHRNTDGATTDDTAGDRYICGQFWNAAAGRWDWKPPPFQIPDAFNQAALFIAPFTLDPNNPNRILAGGQSLWRTNDVKAPNTPTSGPRWARIKAPANGLISAIAISPSDSDRVWVGHDAGEIWRTRNATAANPTWSLISGQGPKPIIANRFCNQILVSPHDQATVLVVFGGFTTGNVWLTEDEGATWTNIGGALPTAPVRAVAVHPQNPDWFYVGTEVGIFASEDRGATWSPTNEGPANVSIDDLFWINNHLVCVTHGRGLFRIDLSPAAVASVEPSGAAPAKPAALAEADAETDMAVTRG